MIKAIIFDAGGVLLGGTIEDVIESVSKSTGVKKELIVAAKERWYSDAIAGQITFSHFTDKFFDFYKIDSNKEEFISAWKKSYLGLGHTTIVTYLNIQK